MPLLLLLLLAHTLRLRKLPVGRALAAAGAARARCGHCVFFTYTATFLATLPVTVCCVATYAWVSSCSGCVTSRRRVARVEAAAVVVGVVCLCFLRCSGIAVLHSDQHVTETFRAAPR